MMNEVEVKILEINPEAIEEKLKALGAKKVFEGILEAVYFDIGNQLDSKGEIFRLRKEGDKVCMTHKKKVEISDAKVMEETEIEVSDFDEAKKLIGALGYKQYTRLKKHRKSFCLDRVVFEIDNYLDEYGSIPAFLEIETEDLELLKHYVEKLGFSMKDCRAWSSKDVISHYSA